MPTIRAEPRQRQVHPFIEFKFFGNNFKRFGALFFARITMAFDKVVVRAVETAVVDEAMRVDNAAA